MAQLIPRPVHSFPSLSVHTASNKKLTGNRAMATVHQIKESIANQQNYSGVLLQYNNSDLELSNIVCRLSI